MEFTRNSPISYIKLCSVKPSDGGNFYGRTSIAEDLENVLFKF